MGFPEIQTSANIEGFTKPVMCGNTTSQTKSVICLQSREDATYVGTYTVSILCTLP